MADAGEITHLVRRVSDGDAAALPVLLEAAYAELRAVAGNLFKDQAADHTLQPTALVNDLCVRLLGRDAVDWNDRKHFIRAAATAMRNLLVEHARAKGAIKRGGGGGASLLLRTDESGYAITIDPADALALDETLTRLSQHDPRLGRVFELRFLAGLSVRQTAEFEGVSERTIESDTRFLRAWLEKELRP